MNKADCVFAKSPKWGAETLAVNFLLTFRHLTMVSVHCLQCTEAVYMLE